jgi:hypothetical protein
MTLLTRAEQIARARELARHAGVDLSQFSDEAVRAGLDTANSATRAAPFGLNFDFVGYFKLVRLNAARYMDDASRAEH